LRDIPLIDGVLFENEANDVNKRPMCNRAPRRTDLLVVARNSGLNAMFT